jgi:NADPH:quinone reductase-like Zn-dependent oxidoreductase
VKLLGIDSVNQPIDRRAALWKRMATDLRPPRLDKIVSKEVSLEETPAVLEAVHRGATRGRVIVKVGQ